MDARPPKDDDTPVTRRGEPDVVVSRRRFTRAGLSGSVVLGSLASKPVLGSQMNHCTVSGQASGNLSRLDDAVTCVFGSPPSFWVGQATWPLPDLFVKGTLPDDKNCAFVGNVTPSVPRVRGTNFNGFTPYAGVPQLAAAFFNSATGQGNEQVCSLTEVPTANPATMLQVLGSMGISDNFYLGGVVVASLLNAAKLGNGYPVTMHTIIAMFNAIVGGLEYPVTDTKWWDRARVVQYLESLYQLP